MITDDGSLYTFGSGNWGVLGHGDETSVSHKEPKKVEFFANRGIKVIDSKVGRYHTLVLTEDNDVYTWGYGGKEGYFSWMVAQEVGALGHGDKKPFFIPRKVKFFDDIESKVVQIATGMYHCAALTEDGQLYTWGRGNFGVLGVGDNSYSLEPLLNEDIEYLKQEGMNPVKIDAADDYTSVLMDNGEVYGFGKNDRGQIGCGSGIGIDFQESIPVPTHLEWDGEEPVPMDDVYCGQNTTLFKDDEGIMWKTGLRLDYTPKMINLENEDGISTNITTFGCGTKHY